MMRSEQLIIPPVDRIQVAIGTPAADLILPQDTTGLWTEAGVLANVTIAGNNRDGLPVTDGFLPGLFTHVRTGGDISNIWAQCSGIPLAINTAADLAFAMETDSLPTWLGKGNQAAGVTDLVNDVSPTNLTSIGTPVFGDTSPSFLENLVLTDSVADGLVAGNSTQQDPTTNSFAILWVGDVRVFSPSLALNLISKTSDVSPFPGFEIRTNTVDGSGNALYRCDVRGTVNSLPFTLTHEQRPDGPQIFLLVVNRTTLSATFSSLEDVRARTWFTNDTVANDGLLSLGNGRLDAANAAHYLAATWIGAAAESLSQTNVFALGSFLGIL